MSPDTDSIRRRYGHGHAGTVVMLTAFMCLPALADARDRTSRADPCADLETAVRDARSPQELELRVQRLQPSQSLLAQCAPRLEEEVDAQVRSTAEQQSAQALQQRAAAPGRQLSGRPLELAVNQQRIDQARVAAQNRASVLEVDTRPVSRTGEAAGADDWTPAQGSVQQQLQTAPQSMQITDVTPSTIVPGADFVIEGAGFGDQSAGGVQGGVRLTLQGTTLIAVVNAWNDTWISAYLHPDPDYQGEHFGQTVFGVQGVTATGAATLRVNKGTEQVTRQVGFEPLLEARVLQACAMKPALFVPLNESTVMFNTLGSTQNGWAVDEWWTDAIDGHCDVGGPPAPQTGGNAVATQLLLSSDWTFGISAVKCALNIRLVGPVGTSPGYSNSNFANPTYCETL